MIIQKEIGWGDIKNMHVQAGYDPLTDDQYTHIFYVLDTRYPQGIKNLCINTIDIGFSFTNKKNLLSDYKGLKGIELMETQELCKHLTHLERYNIEYNYIKSINSILRIDWLSIFIDRI